MAAPQGAPTLAEFAATVVDPRKRKWCDSLPDDVQQQLLSADCSANTAAKWLREALGYDEATPQKVANWLRVNRDRQPG